MVGLERWLIGYKHWLFFLGLVFSIHMLAQTMHNSCLRRSSIPLGTDMNTDIHVDKTPI